MTSAWPFPLLPTTVLPVGLEAARTARAHIRRVGQGWSDASITDALLATSELVTNAVRHGHGDVGLTVRGAQSAVRVEVTDRNPRLPPMPVGWPEAHSGEGGRGLLIVGRIADDWGAEAGPGGKTVWFHLRLR
jgi:anti-sigma regulatory factor (Ser/Thr protein kinase)